MTSVLSLGGDPAGRYLPWSVGLLMFLATLFLALGLVMTDAGTKWRHELSGTISVQIPADSLTKPESYGGVPQADRTARALEVLSETPGIVSVHRLSDGDTAALLRPWLGKEAPAAALPMPVMIDVQTGASEPVNIRELGARLSAASPGAILDDHSVWLDTLSEFSGMAYAIVFGVILLILVSAVTTVIFITHTSLAIHGNVVELLHVIGARDTYVTRYFQIYAAKLVAIGSMVGTAAGAAIVYGLQIYLSELSSDLIPFALLNPAQWALLCLLPLVATLLAAVVAERTVARALGRMV